MRQQLSVYVMVAMIGAMAFCIAGCAQLDNRTLATAGLAAASASKGGNKTGTAVASGAVGISAASTIAATPQTEAQPAAAQSQGTARGNKGRRLTPEEEMEQSRQKRKEMEKEWKAQKLAEKKKKEEEWKKNPANIVSDSEFFEVFKKTSENERPPLYERARKMEDNTLLLEFVKLCPDQMKGLVETGSSSVKTSELAEYLIDHLEGVGLDRKVEGWNTIYGLADVIYSLAAQLDEAARKKYLAIAEKNREKAKKDGVAIFEKFYIGMPVLDFVIISCEDKLAWTSEPDKNSEMHTYADMKTDIAGKDWRQAWKIKKLIFMSKERYRYFKVKGTHDGLLQFVRKYMDAKAAFNDITINSGWWQYTDDEHGLTASLNDDNGVLNIYLVD